MLSHRPAIGNIAVDDWNNRLGMVASAPCTPSASHWRLQPTITANEPATSGAHGRPPCLVPAFFALPACCRHCLGRGAANHMTSSPPSPSSLLLSPGTVARRGQTPRPSVAELSAPPGARPAARRALRNKPRPRDALTRQRRRANRSGRAVLPVIRTEIKNCSCVRNGARALFNLVTGRERGAGRGWPWMRTT